MPATIASDARKCACGSPARPGQWTCPVCNRKAVAKHRGALKQRIARIEEVLDRLTVNNVATRALYAQRCSDRFVVIRPDQDAVAGVVVAFLPGGMLRVMDTSGREHVVPVDQVQEDRNTNLCQKH